MEPEISQFDVFYHHTKMIKKEGERKCIVTCLLLVTATVQIRTNWQWIWDAKMPDMSTGSQPNCWTLQNVLA
jgi:hypothetical protein